MSEIRVDNITNEAGTGKPGFPNGITATGAALTDPEITGGIYLGGTGSVNYLDDYEEGTWTPSFTADSGTFQPQVQRGIYVKVGRMVYITMRLLGGRGTLDGTIEVSGIPFPSSSTDSTDYRSTFSVNARRRWITNFEDQDLRCTLTSNSKSIILQKGSSSSSGFTPVVHTDLRTSTGFHNELILSGTYLTD